MRCKPNKFSEDYLFCALLDKSLLTCNVMKYGEYVIGIGSSRPHDTDPMIFLLLRFAHITNKAPVNCYGGR